MVRFPPHSCRFGRASQTPGADGQPATPLRMFRDWGILCAVCAARGGIMNLRRRDLLVAAQAAGLVNLLSGNAAKAAVAQGVSHDLYRVDDPELIMAAAREIMKEDWVGVLITIDETGMPRARPVGVNDPTDDWSLWMSTRRGSRKTKQIMANPRAALHFGLDDIANGTKNAYYASFTGHASVHTDAPSIAAHGPPLSIIGHNGPIILTTSP